MKYNRLGYLIGEGFSNVFKNKKSTMASIIIMCATMIIFGLFLIIGENVNHFVDNLKLQQGFQVFMKEDATQEEMDKVKEDIRALDGISTIEFVSKEQGLNTMKEKLQEIPNIKINGSDEYNSGSVLNVSFIGIKAEILLHSLEAHKIYVSTGSACSSHKPQPSHVLTAMGLDKKEINGALRISFDRLTEEADVIKAAQIIAKEVATIRRFM